MVPERGHVMKHRSLLALLMVLAVIAAVTADASAVYCPATGRFVQRDPGPDGAMDVGDGKAAPMPGRMPTAVPGNIARPNAEASMRLGVSTPKSASPLAPYADGSHLYQYVGGNSVGYVDPTGLFRRYVCCNPTQISTIQQDEALALNQIGILKAQINAALAADKGQYPWFTAQNLRKALRYLDTAASAIRNKDAKCEPAGASKICNDGAIAWQKWIFGQTVHLCPVYFNYGNNYRGATLVHEGTHFGGTLDATYFAGAPHSVGLIGWQDIASTYDTWILNGFSIP